MIFPETHHKWFFECLLRENPNRLINSVIVCGQSFLIRSMCKKKKKNPANSHSIKHSIIFLICAKKYKKYVVVYVSIYVLTTTVDGGATGKHHANGR